MLKPPFVWNEPLNHCKSAKTTSIISGYTHIIITDKYTHNGCRLPKNYPIRLQIQSDSFFDYVSSTKMSQSVPGGYKYTRVVFKIVSVLNKIKMSHKSKTTVRGFIYSVEETKTIK